jgi:hypothetical protein
MQDNGGTSSSQTMPGSNVDDTYRTLGTQQNKREGEAGPTEFAPGGVVSF